MMVHKDSNIDNPLVAEHDAMDEAEAVTTHTVDEANPHETDSLAFERGADADQVESAEASAMHTDTVAAMEASGDLAEETSEDDIGTPAVALAAQSEMKIAKKSAAPAAKAAVKKQARSTRYLRVTAGLDFRHRYAPKEAIELVQKTSLSKFDGAVEVHARFLPKKGKDSGERFRMVVMLPHGTGKEPKIGVLDEALIQKIKEKGDTEFDILLASPSLMPKVAQVAKVLGPKGKMPNPKTGTVTDDPEATKKAILSGRVEVRADADWNLHQTIGRVSWPLEKLLENYQTLLAVLPLPRLQRVTLAATMGPGIEVDLKK
jgi:large subunit ribosomal protein L1